MKLTKDIEGCSGSEIHPRTYTAGTDCPADLVDAAIALGALPEKEAKAAKAKADAEAAAKLEAEEKTATEPETPAQ